MQLVNEGAIRRDEVDRVRAEIARGEYLTAEKIEIAAERLARALDLRA